MNKILRQNTSDILEEDMCKGLVNTVHSTQLQLGRKKR